MQGKYVRPLTREQGCLLSGLLGRLIRSLGLLPPTDIVLRPFQERLLERIEVARERGHHRNLLVAATGTAFGQEHNVSLVSSNESLFYRLSLGYLNQDGIVKGTTAERVSVGMTYQQRLFNDRLNLRANVKGARTADWFTPGGVLSNGAQFGPTQPIFEATMNRSRRPRMAWPSSFSEWPSP